MNSELFFQRITDLAMHSGKSNIAEPYKTRFLFKTQGNCELKYVL